MQRFRLDEGWSTLLLVWAMVFIAGTAVVQMELIEGLEIVPLIGTVAIVAGLALGKSRFSDRTAHLFSLVYGAFVYFYLLGLILPGELPWRERVFDIVARQVAWLRIAFGEGTGRDGLVFVMHTSAVFWLLGYTASWYTFRHARVWRAVLPTGLVLLSVVYYYFGPRPLVLYLGLYSLLALLYISQTHLVSREKEWRLFSVRYERGIRLTFLRASLFAGLLALLIAWYLPAMSASAAVNDAVSNVNQPWRRFQDTWTRLFSSLRTYGGAATDPYTESLILGGPRTVGDELVMDIYVAEKLPYVYWQAQVFDTYEDGWRPARGEEAIHFPEDGFLDVPVLLARQTVTQTVINYRSSSGVIYGAPEVIGSSRQMLINREIDETGHELVYSTLSRYILRPGDAYDVVSSNSVADATALRAASTNYPAVITDNYLQLPGTISEETLDLATELTAAYDNPFDKAIAVRDWLRRNVVYNDQVPAPPQSVEPVHHLLFVSRQGYCNYYASAMAVMLRSQGIPSRVLGGYAQGEWDEASSSYRVRASNAHTWVEVYFPAYGWIQFEPTASIPVVERPETPGGGGDAFDSPENQPNPLDRESLLGEDALLDNLDPAGQPIVSESEGASEPLGTGLDPAVLLRAGIALVIVGIAAALAFAAGQLNARVEADVRRSYGRLGGWSRHLGIPVRPAHTPYERANLLTDAVPEGRVPIRNLTQEFVRQTFSPAHTEDPAFDTPGQWKQLRPLLLRKTLRHWIDRLRRA